MKSITDISLETVCRNKIYWNSSRPMEKESMYFLLIDRFHDAKPREHSTTGSFNPGFGDDEQLAMRCGGNIKGITAHLDYILGMGFTSVWINPFQQNNPESYHGYAIENFLTVDAGWGSTQDIIELVDAAHKRNMRVFFDMVLNHTGDNWSYKTTHPIYNKGVHYTFGKWRYEELPLPSELRSISRYSRKGKIRNWEETPETWDGDLFTLKDLIQDESDMGKSNQELFLAIYSYWIAVTGCDGFRLDTVKHMRPEWVNIFLTRLKAYALSIGKTDFFVFGEMVGDTQLIRQYSSLDGYLDFPFYFHCKNQLFAKGKKIKYQEEETISMLPVRFLDNHDQIGQTIKERIGKGLQEPVWKNIMAAFILLPGVPCLYYGTEQGLQGSGPVDESIRECLFDPHGTKDLLDQNSSFYLHIKSVNSLRNSLLEGNEHYCFLRVENTDKKSRTDVVAYSLYSEEKNRIVIYSLSENRATVSVSLNRKKGYSSHSPGYLFASEGCLKTDVEIKNDKMIILVDSFGFYIIEFQ